MKKTTLSIFALFLTITIYSQTTIYTGNGSTTSNRTVTLANRTINFSGTNGNLFLNGSNGFVGIGTASPLFNLDVNGAGRFKRLFSENTNLNGSTYSSLLDYLQKSHVLGAGYKTDYIHAGQNNPRYTFNVYDQALSPQYSNVSTYFKLNLVDRAGKERFSVDGNDGNRVTLKLNDFDESNAFKIAVNEAGDNKVYMHLPKENSRIVIAGWGDYLPQHKFVVRGSSLIEGNIITDSNIGIGTSTFTDGTDNFRLSVNGGIRAHRVKVYTDWADFVFEKSYNLPTLEEVEKYIAENGHLKDIPSASDVEKNGIEVGEMNKLLLQKIEELTLYVIELNKEIVELKNK
ncbi:MAG: hypothetical protein WD512_14140 [Candidatus Paceibacterota bacterium]